MIKPSIGRKVWFWPGKPLGLPPTSSVSIPAVLDERQALDATVIFVHGDRCVNLQVVDHAGFTHTMHSATLHQPGDPIPDAWTPHATWMPFQVGQAKGDQPGAKS